MFALQQIYAGLTVASRAGSLGARGEAATLSTSPAVVAEERHSLRKLSLSSPGPNPSPQSNRAPVEITPAAMAISPREALLRRAKQFEDALKQEAIDPQWSAQYEAVVKSAFERRQGSHLESIQCRSTLCKATVKHDSLDARQEFSDMLGPEPFTGGSFYYPAEEGTLTSIAYLGRPGMPFQIPRQGPNSVNKEATGEGNP
jgi:hypothetical protein